MSNDLLPISGARIGQILDQLRAGPKTAADLARVLQPAWFKNEPETATQRLADTLEQMTEAGQIHEIDGGKFEAVPTTADDAPEVVADNEHEDGAGEDGNTDADPTGGTADNHDTELPDVAKQAAAAPKRGRGRPKKVQTESNGAPAPAAEKAPRKTQKALSKDLEPPRIPQLETAAEDYKSVRDRRMALTEQEVEARELLANLMLEHKLTIYKTQHGQIVTVEQGEIKVKVKSAAVDGKGIDE